MDLLMHQLTKILGDKNVLKNVFNKVSSNEDTWRKIMHVRCSYWCCI